MRGALRVRRFGSGVRGWAAMMVAVLVLAGLGVVVPQPMPPAARADTPAPVVADSSSDQPERDVQEEGSRGRDRHFVRLTSNLEGRCVVVLRHPPRRGVLHCGT